MRFLVDNALSPAFAKLLKDAGHDAVHVRERDLQRAEDIAVLEAAKTESRVIVSADTDFGAILTLRGESRPSLIIFRHPAPRRAEQQAQLLLSALPSFSDDLLQGAIVILRQDRIRIRRLT